MDIPQEILIREAMEGSDNFFSFDLFWPILLGFLAGLLVYEWFIKK